jgi:hypothetical protein
MAADVYSVIADPATGAVVSHRWIGRSSVRDRAREVLQRVPDHEATGYFAWGRVTVSELAQISEAHFADGLTPSDVERLAVEFPTDRFWWALHIDY